ncbi:MAG: hypothetical protein JEZ14_02580 [Marinilabiliaceae bacterium]|nr:hypothetical protein [Marinilabiliaceae bacterium]
MLWILLFNLIFGSSGNLFLIPKFEKFTKKLVQDKERVDQILDQRKQTKKRKKKELKTHNAFIKTFQKQLLQQQSTAEELNEIVGQRMDIYRGEKEYELSEHLQMKQLIHESEWNNIVDAVNGDFKKMLKLQQKEEKKLAKRFDRLVKSCSRIDSPDNKQEVIAFMKNMKGIYLNNRKQFYQHLLPENKKLLRYTISSSELETELERIHQLQVKQFKLCIEMQQFLAARTTATEWGRIKGKLKRVLI